MLSLTRPLLPFVTREVGSLQVARIVWTFRKGDVT